MVATQRAATRGVFVAPGIVEVKAIYKFRAEPRLA
jgi:hypothetical protein